MYDGKLLHKNKKKSLTESASLNEQTPAKACLAGVSFVIMRWKKDFH